jgi:hypothetical protein
MATKYTERQQHIPNGNKIGIPNVPASSIARPSKIYPNWDFWVENIPSGNPVT